MRSMLTIFELRGQGMTLRKICDVALKDIIITDGEHIELVRAEFNQDNNLDTNMITKKMNLFKEIIYEFQNC